MSCGVCSVCGAVLTKDEAAFSLKAVSPDREKAECLDCISARMKIDRKELEHSIEFLKKQKCPLFV